MVNSKNGFVDHESVFSNMVGQVRAKATFGFWLNAYAKTRRIPNFLVTGPKGMGKTEICRRTAKCLVQFDTETKKPMTVPETGKPLIKKFYEINCASIPNNMEAFINGWILPIMQDKDATVLFDEAAVLPPKITNGLLTLFNTDSGDKTSYSHGDYVCELDFTRQSFFFATSEIQELDKPLISRFERVDLEDYSSDEMSKIVLKHMGDFSIEEKALADISSVLRGNAREARKMSEKIKTYCAGNNLKKFNIKHWETLKQVLGIMPLGLNANEILILKYLAQSPDGVSLTSLAAKIGLSTQSIQREYEDQLHRHNLMVVQQGEGRALTAKGMQYVRDLTLKTNPKFTSKVVQTMVKAKVQKADKPAAPVTPTPVAEIIKTT